MIGNDISSPSHEIAPSHYEFLDTAEILSPISTPSNTSKDVNRKLDIIDRSNALVGLKRKNQKSSEVLNVARITKYFGSTQDNDVNLDMANTVKSTMDVDSQHVDLENASVKG